jgi:CrcB protein
MSDLTRHWARRLRRWAGSAWRVGVSPAVSTCLIIGLGGFLGANCRYLVGGWAANQFGSAFPFGTLIINLTGSFVIGLFLTWIGGRFVAPPGWRLFFAVGFLGAYTTFSTYTFESLALLQSRAYLAGLANLFGSAALGIGAVALGSIVGGLM